MVGLQTLDLAIGVRVPASQPTFPICGLKAKATSRYACRRTLNYCFFLSGVSSKRLMPARNSSTVIVPS